MTNALFVIAVIAAAAVCPLMMWWNGRRGGAAACCPPKPDTAVAPTADELRRRMDDLGARIAEHDAKEPTRLAQSGRAL